MNKREEWRSIKGYDGYEVSNLGQVRSLDRVVKGINNKDRPIKGVVLRAAYSRGYPSVSLCNKTKRTITVHRLVATAFIDNPENKDQVNHINGVKDDNRLVNLEWVTRSENIQHSYNILGHKKLWKPVIQVSVDGGIIREFEGIGQAERATGVRRAGISSVCHGRAKSAGGFKWKFA